MTLTPRVGIESEPVPNWVHARAGSYIEPSRFADSTPRQHFTLGGDIRLFRFSPWGIFGDQIWRITLGADLAPRYQNYDGSASEPGTDASVSPLKSEATAQDVGARRPRKPARPRLRDLHQPELALPTFVMRLAGAPSIERAPKVDPVTETVSKLTVPRLPVPRSIARIP